jgi:hypothetical protein
MRAAAGFLCILRPSACGHHFGARADAGPPPVIAAAPKGYVEGHDPRPPRRRRLDGPLSDAAETLALPIFIGGTGDVDRPAPPRRQTCTRPLTRHPLGDGPRNRRPRHPELKSTTLVTDTYRGTVVLGAPTAPSRPSTPAPSDCRPFPWRKGSDLREEVPPRLRGVPVGSNPAPAALRIHSHNPMTL